ncbi:unnamed protein product [Auanema sp. JU1783]|nr:unnamed protein product [Auanema sp. JU1783]
MSIDMNKNYFKLLKGFRRQDLAQFVDDHDRLFKVAKDTEDHLAVTSHYYSVMSSVINDFFGGNFHFAAPKDKTGTMEQALYDLHQYIGQKLDLKSDVSCLDIGCGIGGVIKDLANTEATLTGITIAPNEAEMGNEDMRALGISERCSLVVGDCHNMPLNNQSFDAAYAVYALKYFPRLSGVVKEVSRILKPNGKFLIYDLIKTDKYDEKNEEHRQCVEGLEYACGMPSLHTKEEMVQAAADYGLELIEEEDLSEINGSSYHYCFSHSPLFMWLVRSPAIGHLIRLGESLNILPKGFLQFNKIFLAGTVDKIVRGGEMGILSGSQIFVFQKKN